MTLTEFMARSHMQRTVKMTLKGKTSRKWTSGQNIYEFEKEINPNEILTLSLGYIHVYDLVYISDLR